MTTQPTRRGTRRSAVAGVALVVALGVLAGCGGGGGSTPPKSLSLHGEAIPVTTLTTGLKQLCTVTHEALNAATAKTAYFSGPYNSLHQLVGIVGGSRGSDLLTAMETFERGVLGASPDGATTVKDANTLLGLVNSDLQSLKLQAVKC